MRAAASPAMLNVMLSRMRSRAGNAMLRLREHLATRGAALSSRGAGSTVVVNGKFLSQATTGTQRYAAELTAGLASLRPGGITLVIPRDGTVPDALVRRVHVRRSRLRGQLFEQVALPWAARGNVLLSLGGPAPISVRNQVVTVHDVSVFRFPRTYSRSFGAWYRNLYRVLARRAVGVLTVSEFSADEIADVLGRARDRIRVVPNGSDHLDNVESVRPAALPAEVDRRSRSAVSTEQPWVLCVGTFARHKNIAAALTAFERADIRSVVVGVRGSAHVFAPTERAGWPHATFVGRLNDQELVWLYREATALVFPSLYEGFGLPIVEAQRLGCPVIAMNVASIPEVAGEGAILCDPDAPEQLANAVLRLHADQHLRSQLITLGRDNASRYLWSHSALLLHQSLDDVIGLRFGTTDSASRTKA